MIVSSINCCHCFCTQYKRYEPAVPVMTAFYASTSSKQHTDTVVSSVSHLCWYQNHKTAVQSAHQLFHTNSAVAFCWATVSVSSICLHRVSAHLPTVFINNLHGRHLDSCLSHQFGMHRAFQGIHRSREPGCDKRRVKWYIDLYHYSSHGGCCHNQYVGSLRLSSNTYLVWQPVKIGD